MVPLLGLIRHGDDGAKGRRQEGDLRVPFDLDLFTIQNGGDFAMSEDIDAFNLGAGDRRVVTPSVERGVKGQSE
jgi:hypothetical protein